MTKRYTFLALTALTLFIGLAVESRLTARDQPMTAGVVKMLDAATTGSSVLGTGTMSQCRETAIYAQWSSGVDAGVITVETAHDASYSGTWASLGTLNWSAASKEDVLQITGVHAAVRTRVSTTVTNGTVTTWAVCN